jgi:outer membrane lipoprotein LolB
MLNSFAVLIARCLLLAVALMFSGCASLVALSISEADLEFELQGRAALRYGAEGGSTRITWRHSAAADDLLITTPLGQGVARITGQNGQVRLVTADGKEYSAANAETLTESVLGWRLPLAGLPDWVRGRPAAGRPAQTRNDDGGRLAGIEQDAWRITYTAWAGELPSRLTLNHAGVDGKAAVEIRLIIDQWKVGP